MSTSTTGTAGFKPALWTPGDWNAFFGFGTNILVNDCSISDGDDNIAIGAGTAGSGVRGRG